MCTDAMRLPALPFALVLMTLAILTTPAHARTIDVRSLVTDLAAELAQTEHRPTPPVAAAAAIDYTQYLGIRVKPGSEIWAERSGGFQLHPMPLGSLFATPIELNLVEGGRISPLRTNGDFYEHSLPVESLPPGGDLGISGFRITAPLNTPGTMDEVIVFQGASYFRVLSKGQVYGVSARALSIGAGRSEPEEFPTLTRFWIETPEAADTLVIHGLLDSRSVTGAYTFTLHPGAPSVVDVEATLFPRRDLDSVGIAPLSSMFFYAVGDGDRHVRDYRPEVHDSDGLLIATGRGERLWRPLRNPKALRASSFSDTGLRGFGLMQRERNFQLYHDLEANYHRRPSAWIEPTSQWGAGAVELFEIPTDGEYHDNIVAQWRPAEPLRVGSVYRYSYRISWPDHAPIEAPSVKWTRSGPAYNALTGPDTERFVIDYALSKPRTTLPDASVTANVGTVSAVSLQPNPETGGLRLSFLYAPAGNDVAEFRAELSGPGTKGAETWLYQWARAKD
jgi:glucans biosynthesis protein